MVALKNKIQIVLSFLKKIKGNIIMCLNLIGEYNILHLRNCT